MELKEQLLEHIKKNGLKKSYVADKIGITPSTMSNYLHGNLIITDTLEQRIKDYLDGQN